MTTQRHQISREEQFRLKEASRRVAAAAPIEEKFVKLVELQKISSELARQDGRKPKQPWPIPDSSNKSVST